jgi:serine/threonine-protein kinase
MLGRALKQFVAEQPLGEGGMGVVYRALDTKLQRPVALKVLSAALTADPEKKKRFLLEARAAARIVHPAIAQVYDVDEADGTIFIAMELVQGRTVQEMIRKRELDLLGTVDIAIQVAEGLAKAHEAGIVHRDIKPANVMLTGDGHAKVLDFGLAKLMDPSSPSGASQSGIGDMSTLTQTQIGAVMGTAAYMSPEQVKGDAIDARSDLFSLGVMIYEMATWESPFRRGSMMETMHAVAFDETPSIHAVRQNLPPGLQRIVSKCLRKRPADRYATASSLIEDLRFLRREMESGWHQGVTFRDRVAEMLDRLRHVQVKEYAWLGAGVLGLALAIYLGTTALGWGRLLMLVVAGLFLYRHFRNRPHRLREALVRKLSHLPEVRLIAAAGAELTVVVDRSVAQLYGRINDQVNLYNHRRFFGRPLVAAVRHDLRDDEFQRLLTGPGVQYVRDDSVAPPTPG